MAEVVHLPNLRDGYVELVDFVARTGVKSSPRGKATIEVEDATFTVEDTADVLPIGVGRNINTKIAVVEALQLVGARADSDLVTMASPAFREFAEYDGHFHGAYGRRIGNQFDHVINKIRHDRDTRQAVITLWDPTLDNIRGFRDYPCTLSLGFRLRGDRVNMSVTMRSNDVWRGTAYDVFQFTQLQWTLANVLGIEPGLYTHTAWSLHLYEDDFAKVDALSPTPTKRLAEYPTGFSAPGTATRILEGRKVRHTNESDRWYIRQRDKIIEDAS